MGKGEKAMRDSQRQRVYDSERSVKSFQNETQRLTFEQVEQLVSAVYEGQTYRTYITDKMRAKPSVKKGRAGTSAYGTEKGISVPQWAWHKAIVLHELAHVVVLRKDPRRSHEAHGWLFCRVYLELVEEFIGADVAQELREAFDLMRVAYSATTKLGKVTEEQRAAKAAPKFRFG